MPVNIPDIQFIRKRKRMQFGPPPAGLTLIAAEYNHVSSPVLILTFDGPIDIASMDGSQIVVDDADDLGLRFTATGAATMDGPATVRIGLVDAGDATGTGTTLTAGAANGILPAAGGDAWPGVGSLGLPFP